MSLFGNKTIEETKRKNEEYSDPEITFEVGLYSEDQAVNEAYEEFLNENMAIVRFFEKGKHNKFVDILFRSYDDVARSTAKGQTSAHPNDVSFKVNIDLPKSRKSDGVPIYIRGDGTAVFGKDVSPDDKKEILKRFRTILDLAEKNAMLICAAWNETEKGGKYTGGNIKQLVEPSRFSQIISTIIVSNPEYTPQLISLHDTV